ncbi:MAG: LuxR C-terminal-related transcriptional regulator [Bacteroidota bacterium]
METPRFILDPPSETEMETACLLAKGKKYKEIADIRCLSEEAIKGHTRSLRYKFHTNKTHKAVNWMIGLKYISVQILLDDLPADWQRFVKP